MCIKNTTLHSIISDKIFKIKFKYNKPSQNTRKFYWNAMRNNTFKVPFSGCIVIKIHPAIFDLICLWKIFRHDIKINLLFIFLLSNSLNVKKQCQCQKRFKRKQLLLLYDTTTIIIQKCYDIRIYVLMSRNPNLSSQFACIDQPQIMFSNLDTFQKILWAKEY